MDFPSKTVSTSKPQVFKGEIFPKSEIHSDLHLLLEGIKYIHSANVLHRDLKPTNLLVNRNYDLKICDFGLAITNKENDEFMTEYIVSCEKRSPELLVGCGSYGTCIYMWSIGCIFAKILGRKPIFPGTDYLNQLQLIINILSGQKEEDLKFIDVPKSKEYMKSLPFSRGMDFSQLYPHGNPLALALLRKMLAFDPTKRISAIEAFQHPYMVGLYDPSYVPPAKLTWIWTQARRLEKIR